MWIERSQSSQWDAIVMWQGSGQKQMKLLLSSQVVLSHRFPEASNPLNLTKFPGMVYCLTQVHLLRDSTTHNELGHRSSSSNQENAPCWHAHRQSDQSNAPLEILSEHSELHWFTGERDVCITPAPQEEEGERCRGRKTEECCEMLLSRHGPVITVTNTKTKGSLHKIEPFKILLWI